MTTVSEYRWAGAFLGCVFLFVVPGLLLGPVIFDSVLLAVLPAWVVPVSLATAALGLWHFVTAVYALDEDLAALTAYTQAHDAAPLVLPFSLFIGTRSVYRRLFAPALVARQRWQARRQARRHAASGADFPSTLPQETER